MASPMQELLPGIPGRMSHANLTEALASAQAEFPDIPKTRTATVRGKSRSGSEYEYTYQYADFADILKAIRPVLAKHGLAFSQPIRRKELKMHLTSILRFGDKESIESDGLPIPEIMEPQQMGSLLSYWRRYDGCSLLGIQPDEDDDARRAAIGGGHTARGKQEAKMERQEQDIKRISPKDVRAFFSACNASGKKPNEIKAWLKDQRLTSIEELPAELAERAIKWATSEGTQVPKDLIGVLGESAKLAAREKAMKTLFGVAAEYHVPESDLKQAAYEIYHVKSLTELTTEQLSEHAVWVKTVANQQTA